MVRLVNRPLARGKKAKRNRALSFTIRVFYYLG